ncbi:MAG TPA: filamentous hemagglutinin N-terminal domain-containing protein [Paraburkholderia sp.]|uniref:two-partner secretion domain-containing protein n=1 Tax=Paraburkholderia sp. TaxID=1926495 RepID=UPI002ED109DE
MSRAQSLPTNGQVVAGQASISQTNPNTMTINQGTQRTVINWNSFDVGQGNTVQFNQPNAQAQALNRVTGSMPSNIQGSLLANGQVLIQNANGVLFSKSAVVNVGSLLATTKSIDSNAFMAGNPLALQSTGTNASVVNDGTINAQGYVVMMGDQVRNSGTITTAQGGQVALAAGDAATVALPNGQGIQLTLTNASANALVENSGTIKADNGAVLLTARGSNTLLNTVVNLSGVVRAGTVVADAGNTGDVAVTGKIDASNAAGQGGTVVLSGDRVGVFGNASIDASGATQGGKVIIGGDSLHKLAGTQAQGMLQDGVQFANYTQVDAGASVNAGSAHGNGGFVETSGHSLDVQGQVGAAAPEGKAGEWLIDPTDVTISNDGIVFWTGGNNGVTAKDQSVVAFTGQSSTGNGLRMGDPHFSSSTNMTVSDNASLSLSGVSDTGRGVYVGALNLTTSQNGVANIKGKSRSDFGVDIGFTSATEFKDSGGGWGSRYSHLTASDNSVINIDGQSTNNVGTVLAGYFNIAGHGALNVNGTGATAGAQLYGPVNAADNSTINVTGQGGSAFGVWVPARTSTVRSTRRTTARSTSAVTRLMARV